MSDGRVKVTGKPSKYFSLTPLFITVSCFTHNTVINTVDKLQPIHNGLYITEIHCKHGRI